MAKRIGFIAEMGRDELSHRIFSLCEKTVQRHDIAKPFVFFDINGDELKEETTAGIVLFLAHIAEAWKEDHS